MKLPITDQFLWDIFNAISKTEDVLRFIIHPPRTFREIRWASDDPIYQKYRKILRPQKFAQLVYYAKKNNFIKIENLKGNSALVLTKNGFDKAIRSRFKLEDTNKKKRKDDKWIMLIFDVPEKYKKSRELLRKILYSLGYKMFQQSVWVTPYDVSEKTEILLQTYSLDASVKIFLIEAIK
ncbi:MAG: CRISPR-associated endonuclease Cas2 [Candidatus Staskawiczbacteria bacterium RIFCSPHIGHO2_02_FULL_42_22]|uniref:CRISPR-associated endonuclease Cas2 n=1 Tax=Candidatus Staskawiczbacteria bacterium RIFCSPHIGHO2_02_FULL_42_22 TaxID=1802207 RepID=A0A1G2I1P3_9BACT|nr:MAG: CRISPR-associated endonuclease Cas2 [Candidatus Staskawiczbacteria bacterium RIFCSPHIGHO2_02_FULL_42_22]